MYDIIPEDPQKKRPNGHGSIGYEARRNAWRVRYTIKMKNGVKKRKTVYAKSRAEAERKLYRALGWWNALDELQTEEGSTRHVYFIQGVHGGPIKIGTCVDIEARFQAIQSCSPVLLRILLIIPHAGHDIETKLHRQFALLRLHGEWFDSCSEILQYIEQIKKQQYKIKVDRAIREATERTLLNLRVGRSAPD